MANIQDVPVGICLLRENIPYSILNGKSKVHLRIVLEGPERECDAKLYPFFNLGSNGGWSWRRPDSYIPRERELGPIEQ